MQWLGAALVAVLLLDVCASAIRRRMTEPLAFGVEVLSDCVRFVHYPFPPSSMYPSGEVRPHEIADIEPKALPPQIFTKRGEFLFVSAGQATALTEFARRHGVPVVDRHDVWDDVLAPFLDTTLSERMERRIRERLRSVGMDDRRVARLRRRFGLRMWAYNIGLFLWDWVHLGMFDLFLALGYGSPLPRVSQRRFRRIYWEAMEIAALGPASPLDDPGGGSGDGGARLTARDAAAPPAVR